MSGRCGECNKPLVKSVGVGPKCARKSLRRAGFSSNKGAMQGHIDKAASNPGAFAKELAARGLDANTTEQVINQLRTEAKNLPENAKPFKLDRKGHKDVKKATEKAAKNYTSDCLAEIKHMEITADELLRGKNLECYARLPDHVKKEISQEDFDKKFWTASEQVANANDAQLAKAAKNPKKVEQAKAVVRQIGKQAQIPQRAINNAVAGKPDEFIRQLETKMKVNQFFEGVNSALLRPLGIAARLLQHMMGNKKVKLYNVLHGTKEQIKSRKFQEKQQQKKAKYIGQFNQAKLREELAKPRDIKGVSREEMLRVYLSRQNQGNQKNAIKAMNDAATARAKANNAA